MPKFFTQSELYALNSFRCDNLVDDAGRTPLYLDNELEAAIAACYEIDKHGFSVERSKALIVSVVGLRNGNVSFGERQLRLKFIALATKAFERVAAA